MKRFRFWIAICFSFFLVLISHPFIERLSPLAAQIPPAPLISTPSNPEKGELQSFDEAVKNHEKLTGLFTIYRHKETGKYLAEIKPEQLDRNFLAVMTLESGIGERGLYRGIPLRDLIFNLRRLNNNLQFVLPNTNFRTQLGDPQERSLKQSFSDSILLSLPIRSIHPKTKAFLIDLEPLVVSDALPNLNRTLANRLGGSFMLDPTKSYLNKAQVFPQNIELESVFGFMGNLSPRSEFNAPDLNSLPDSNAFTLKVRYSFSQLPTQNGYRPRYADERVGYFVTAYQDLSKNSGKVPFVRYINRWQLEKKNPSESISPPKQPITFWIENTVPLEYRDAIREGTLMWNRAFEKIGFKNAIVVKQMPDRANWDPADIRYNTIRWFNSIDGFFAMGPSRVNPLTGQILDADIIIDSSLIRAIRQNYENVGQQNNWQNIPFLARLTGNPNLCNYGMDARRLKLDKLSLLKNQGRNLESNQSNSNLFMSSANDLCYGMEAMEQFKLGAMSLSLLQNVLPSSDRMKDYINQFVRELAAHEVGHTLGLRHNFHGSAMLAPEELNNPEVTSKRGLAGSVMDYNAVNLAPQGTKQGDFFASRIGAYDEWAIAYGYTPINAIIPSDELKELGKITSLAAQPELAYAPDEDAAAGLDPLTQSYDLSNDLVTYTQWQFDNARVMWNRIEKRFPGKGASFNDTKIAFNQVFNYYANNLFALVPYVGGQSFNRYRSGDAVGRLPFEPIPVTKQREALASIQRNLFAADAFNFSPNLLNKLAPSRWYHWGTSPQFSSLDYPILERILSLQTLVLSDLLSSDRLQRLRDTELKTNAGEALTLPELFDTLQQSIWSEVLTPTNDMTQISSLRRSLQRQHMNLLVNLALRNRLSFDKIDNFLDLIVGIQTSNPPEDARTLAWYQLRQLRDRLANVLRDRGDKLDTYTKAHLEEASDRLTKAIDAKLLSQ
ncbi:zinc-dependent metalloprotease [Pseudanabaena sp. FACHB-1998]|uniref:zinc-dependent metalloprotease n=1 Tax=Pseudanabaena sp. FACHB-1998 TaxID=2692858 RepID=UPI0016814BF4|nr:zinc-dependent metalloprotease [Pseudanabaena sp. FACHB-1998]MBD2178488.1 zinc-dependent metalloprotease [Pseudanabaena sp. FACHB-1998]